MAGTVIEALRRFLPAYLERHPALDTAGRRAVWAITHCRTAAMGGHLHACPQCATRQFRFHSCNHRSCPQCGRHDTARWVERELGKRVGAPTFMVTFTVPEALRGHFLAAPAPMYRLLFAAASSALADTLANPRWLGASLSGFTLVLHTWNQRLGFHPHLHAIVPGAGLGPDGRVVTVSNPRMLVPQPALVRIFRARIRDGLRALHARAAPLPPVDPALWRQPWGVHLQGFGSGETLIKYLGAYVYRTAIGDSRIVEITDTTVSFRWKDRARGGVPRVDTVPGTEFVARYLRHVLPGGLRSIRHYGFCHPAARAKRERIAFHTGRPLVLSEPGPPPPSEPPPPPACPDCGGPMPALLRLLPAWRVPRTAPSCAAARSRAPPTERSCA